MIEDAIVETIRKASIYLPPDVKEALKRAYEQEKSNTAKAQLRAILDNVELAEKLKRPICQDTGIMMFYVKAGYNFPALNVIEGALIRATKRATQEIPLRPNSVNPFTGENSGDNTGRFIPYIHWELVPGDEVEITVVPKGGGSEYPAVYRMIPPGRGLEGLKETVVDAILSAGAMPCPPTIVGVGVGGGADIAMTLAKKAATLRKIGSKNPDPQVAELERRIYEGINELGIGPMGVGGRATVLAVHIEWAHRHPANYPVAVVFQCWAARRATVRIRADGSYEISQ
ncbi:fumarate hydratase alpha subunit [Thermococcus barophilus]|uniref:Fumarate hydratase alpha subunit n=2 Tax=Thermococcus barophilus TaxID=55802 RepID=A0A0S1X890_THEBA|nr:fumarate hydratase alpha subunit [Thermococcus barophilus]